MLALVVFLRRRGLPGEEQELVASRRRGIVLCVDESGWLAGRCHGCMALRLIARLFRLIGHVTGGGGEGRQPSRQLLDLAMQRHTD